LPSNQQFAEQRASSDVVAAGSLLVRDRRRPSPFVHWERANSYVLLEANEQNYNVQFRRVDYDREAVIKAIEHSRHPTPSFLIGFMRGERITSSDPGVFQASQRAEKHKP
jgi:hypothetical protein